MKKRLVNYLKSDPNYLAIISLFIIWKVLLLFILLVSFEIIPLYSESLLGGGYNNYLTHFYIFPWANFDGEHFMSIAQFGYKQYQQAFFPLFPKMITLGMNIFGQNLKVAALSGLVISSVTFLTGLIFLYKLLRLDYSSRFSLGVIVVLLLYPASFYFNAVYTEALFLMLITA